MHAPNMAPTDCGTHPRNKTLSPGVKWKYGSMLPTARALVTYIQQQKAVDGTDTYIGPSMLMSMPLSCASTQLLATTSTRRVRREIPIVPMR